MPEKCLRHVEPSAQGQNKETEGRRDRGTAAWSPIQRVWPLCILPILQLHPLLHLVPQPTSSPAAWVLCPQTCAPTPLHLCPVVPLCWNSISSLLHLGNFCTSSSTQPKCHLLWEAFPDHALPRQGGRMTITAAPRTHRKTHTKTAAPGGQAWVFLLSLFIQ